jgi:hypothetical protein
MYVLGTGCLPPTPRDDDDLSHRQGHRAKFPKPIPDLFNQVNIALTHGSRVR